MNFDLHFVSYLARKMYFCLAIYDLNSASSQPTSSQIFVPYQAQLINSMQATKYSGCDHSFSI